MDQQNKQTNIRLPLAYREALRILAKSRTLREHRKVTASEVARAALYAYFVSPAVVAEMKVTTAMLKQAKAEMKGEHNGK